MAEVHIVISAATTNIADFQSKAAPLLNGLAAVEREDQALRERAGPEARSYAPLQSRDSKAIEIGKSMLNGLAAGGFKFQVAAAEDPYRIYKDDPDLFFGVISTSVEAFKFNKKALVGAPARKKGSGEITISIITNDNFPEAVGRFYADALSFCGCSDVVVERECDEWDD